MGECPAVVVAQVHGYAIGAGFQLALAADLRIAALDAWFAMRETSLGLVADLGGTGRSCTWSATPRRSRSARRDARLSAPRPTASASSARSRRQRPRGGDGLTRRGVAGRAGAGPARSQGCCARCGGRRPRTTARRERAAQTGLLPHHARRLRRLITGAGRTVGELFRRGSSGRSGGEGIAVGAPRLDEGLKEVGAMGMQPWMAMRSMSRDSSVAERSLSPGTRRRVLTYAAPYRSAIITLPRRRRPRLGLVVTVPLCSRASSTTA